MARKYARIMVIMLLCVAIGFTVIIYNVAASKGKSPSTEEKLADQSENIIGINNPTPNEEINSIKQLPPIPDIQTSEDLTVTMGNAESGDTIPKGATVYHLENGVTEVHTPDKGCILNVKDSEAVLIDTQNGKKPATYIFDVPSGAVIENNESKTFVYDNLSNKDILFTIVNLSTPIIPKTSIDDGWLAEIKDESVNSLSHFRADWTVPDEPINSNVTQFYFNGIEYPGDYGRGIIQPVLEWNQGFNQRWTGTAWYWNWYWEDQIGSSINCNEGDSITGTMTRVLADYWWVSFRDNTTDQRSYIYVKGGSMPFSNLKACFAFETKDPVIQPTQEFVGSCYFDDIVLLDGANDVDVEWIVDIKDDAKGIISVNYDLSRTDDSWVNILTPNPNNQWVDMLVDLQGANRPEPEGWHVPISVGFYPPNSDDDTLLNPNAANYYFNGEANFTDLPGIGERAFFHCPGKVSAGSYDITIDSTTTLLNVKRAVNVQY